MHAGVALLLHAGVSGLSRWSFEPGLVIPLAVLAALYLRGIALVPSALRRPSLRRRVFTFAGGWLVLVAALISPLHAASEELFSAHMIQHELLMALAAPLLVVAEPMPVLLRGLPVPSRRAAVRLARSRHVRRVWKSFSRPFDAWLLHGVMIWLWHVPALFEATLTNDFVHALQHLSFLGSACLFWWSITYGQQRAARGMSIVYLFTTAVHTGVLGALMTFAHRPWYPAYASGAAAWGLTPMMDQQLAGLVMWIPASVAYLVGALALMHRWLRDSEWAVAEREQIALAATSQ
jgi:cytochrome c oxidase assembly factor CtaG